ncbi:MAG: AF1514 family protein [Desulfobacteraceae bacterium]|jgi:hypothetical protein
MAEIKPHLDSHPFEKIALTVSDPDLDMATAGALAKEKARAMDPNAMMLSFHSGKTGEFWPNYECGGNGRPPWIVFAEARGYNLLIDINDGQFEFFYLRM